MVLLDALFRLRSHLHCFTAYGDAVIGSISISARPGALDDQEPESHCATIEASDKERGWC